MKLNQIDETFAATAQLAPQDVAVVKAQGFDTIICNRPDGEEFGQPSAEMIRAACADCDVAFHYVPMATSGPGPTTLDDFASAVSGASTKVLAYCRSGARSAMLYQAIRR